MNAAINILSVADLLGLSGESWAFWRALLAAIFNLPLSDEQAAIVLKHTGRSRLFDGPIRQIWFAIGRRGGKSRVISLIAIFLACFCDYSGVLAPGETGVILLSAPSQRQARVLLNYILGFLNSAPMLARLIARETEFSVELTNGVLVEVRSANFKTVRGFTIIAAIVDEIAFLPQDDSAIPDTELLSAIKGAMGTIRGSVLICSSTPHAQRGELHESYRANYGNDDSNVAFFNADTMTANPSMDPQIIEAAFTDDPMVASSEYGSGGFVRFRSDCERLYSEEALDACTDFDRPLILEPNFTEETA